MRKLTLNEITQLQAQQCLCSDWLQIQVNEEFTPDTIRNVRFSGKIRLGTFRHVFTADGIEKQAGIYNATLHNCTVENNAYIANIHNHIANYKIEEQAFIENVNTLAVTQETAFGNGTRVAVLDEAGSREIRIYEGLSSQTAHLFAWHCDFLAKNNSLIDSYIKEKTSQTGTVGKASRIVNCGTIRNVFLHENATIEGATLLENGTVSPRANIGASVIARDFILAPEATVADAAQIERCFVGEGTVLGKQFSATDSLFFANCQGFHGEAVSVFAAPYTVTHHKSTLLIAGEFSFFNAGSASNQSNHAYKLGAIHYGALGRGSKMASSSYLFAPYRTGVFSLVMGVHKKHIDTRKLPFSYLMATPKGETVVVPALALKSIGTYRDADKWQKRDLRKHCKTDRINFSMLNPYSIEQIFAAKDMCEAIVLGVERSPSSFTIKEDAIPRGLELYKMALDIYFGEMLIKRLEQNLPLQTQNKSYDKWVDLAGLIAPKKKVEEILQKKYADLQSIEKELDKIDENFDAWQWDYVSKKLENRSPSDILDNYILAQESLFERLKADAAKDYEHSDTPDFAIENHSFIAFLQKETEGKTILCRQLKK